MGNRIQSALQAVKRRKRGVASVVSVGAIGALALGTLGAGTAVAHGMVDSGRIQDQTIQTRDIGQNGVGASEVGPNAIYKWNINRNSVGLWELNDYARDQLDNEGERGPKGEKGEPGEDGVSGYEVVGVEERFNAGNHELTAECPDGKNAVGGGFQASADGAGGNNTDVIAADLSGLEETDNGWTATGYTVAFDNSEATGSPAEQGNMRVRVVCASLN